ncbi:MAG TPA: hypothetical protein PLH94_05300 [Fimbriimonadaceae bacterium]|nr:hypothetical protein [Fimbriimonadaceae bacterium]
MSLAPICLFALLTMQSAPSLDADLDVALGTASLSAKTAQFDPNLLRFFRQSEFSTPTFEAMHENVWRGPFIADNWRRQFAVSGGKPNESLAAAGRMIGLGTRRTLLGNPIAAAEEAAKKTGALKAVLERMKSQGIIKGEILDPAEVPETVQQAAALVLQVALETINYRRAAFEGVTDFANSYQRMLDYDPESDDPLANRRALELFRSVDMRYLFAGAHDITLAATQAQALVQATSPTTTFSYSVSTDWGVVVLSGGGNTAYPEGPVLLIIDTGGADSYLNVPSNQSLANWVSVVIDTSGNDKYLSLPALADTPVDKFDGRRGKGKFGPGSALFGVSVGIDGGGEDVYRSHRPGLGSATMGAAVLLDAGGDDVYDAYADSLGYGKFGIGVLEDLSGKDRYSGFSQVEGCGQTSGCGMLLDRAGDDVYVANDTVLDFASPQSKDHNANMSQGAGNGRRADYLDGHSLSGGIGILYDQGGADMYSCGIFGQGVGYWEGIGFLWDSEGNDTYSGQWYAQGASAHFAIGYLEDEGGDDLYLAPMNMAMGAGHDFGTGYLVDRGGNDKYRGPNLSLGAGNANGIGWFVDLRGDDTYDSSGVTLGKAAEAPKGTLRERGLCLGLFMDLGGKDMFPAQATWAKDATRIANWTDRGPSPAESQLGIFWDR